jgi:hypothetical protein
MTFADKVASWVDNAIAHEDELIYKLAKTQERIQEFQDLQDKLVCPDCGIQGSGVNHESGDCGWCDDCGQVYVYDEDDVIWVDPVHGDHSTVFPSATTSQRQSLVKIWNNDRVSERIDDLADQCVL